MKICALFFLCCVGLCKVSTEDLIPTAVLQNCQGITRWDQLIPALQMMKNSTTIKKERLYNVIKIIKYLLSDEIEAHKCCDCSKDKTCEELKALSNMNDDIDLKQLATEKMVNDKLKEISEMIDDKLCINAKEEPIDEVACSRTTEINNVLNKISEALSKVNGQNECEEFGRKVTQTNTQESCRKLTKVNQEAQSKLNYEANRGKFTIPCQKASDILEETLSFTIPKEAMCECSMNSILKSTKSVLEKLPPGKIVPNSVTCTDGGDPVAMLFKPKIVSLMQVYGNLLRKISITVLVPYHVSKVEK